MPELPEVETIRRIIEPQITGRKIESIQILNEKIIAYPQAQEFAVLLSDQNIQNMSRRGKFLTIHLDNGDWVVLHLRMTGQLLVMPEEYLAGKGREYRNTPYLKVYGRASQQCRNCSMPIEKITIASRSSCYCPNCQKKRSLYHEE